jgi:hypothetical protein
MRCLFKTFSQLLLLENLIKTKLLFFLLLKRSPFSHNLPTTERHHKLKIHDFIDAKGINAEWQDADFSMLLFVKHLAMRILTRKYRIRQQYTDW